MKKLLTFILGSILALNLSISVANSAAKEVRVAYFLEWPSPNLEDMQKKNFAKALGVPVKWTNFTNGGAMTDAMLAGDIDISYSQGLVPFINAVKSKAPLKLVDIAMEYGMGGTTCVTSNASGITKANGSELEGKKVAVPLGTMAEYVFDESMKVVGADRSKMDIILNVVMMVLAYFIAKKFVSGVAQQKCIAIECGLQNGTLAVFVATLIFDEVAYIVPTGAYALLMYITGFIFIYILRKNN